MNRMHSFFDGEHRLLRLAGEATPLQALEAKLSPDAQKEVQKLKTVGQEAINNARLRGVGAAEAIKATQDKLLPALQKQFDHLKTGGKADADSVADINQALKDAKIPELQVKLDGANLAIDTGIKQEAPNVLTYLKTQLGADFENFLKANPAVNNVFSSILEKMDPSLALQTELNALITQFNTLSPNQQKAFFKMFQGQPYNGGDKAKVQAVVDLFKGPELGKMIALFKGAESAGAAPEDPVETLAKAKKLIEDAKAPLAATKDANPTEYNFLKERLLGQLSALGVDVNDANEGKFLTGDTSDLKLVEYRPDDKSANFSRGFQKVMGNLRVVMAYYSKFMSQFDKMKPGAKKPAEAPKGPEVDPNAPAYKLDVTGTEPNKKAVASLSNIKDEKLAVAKAGLAKAVKDAGVEDAKAKADPDPKKLVITVEGIPDAKVKEIENQLKKLIEELKKPDAPPTFDAEKIKGLRKATDDAYNKVSTTVKGPPPNPGALKLTDLDPVLAAITEERKIPAPAAGSPDVATYAARMADIGNKEFEMKSLQKYIDVHSFYNQNVTLANERATAINEKNAVKLKDVAGRIITMNELELNKLKEKVDGKDLANTDLTKLFIGNTDWATRIKAIEDHLPIYRAEANANPRRFEIAEENKTNRKVEGSKLFKNSAALGVAGITDGDGYYTLDDIRPRGDGRWAINIDGTQDSGDWLQIAYNGDHWEHGLSAGKDDNVGMMTVEAVGGYESTGDADGTRQANEIIGKLKAIETRMPVDPAKVPPA